MRHPEFYRLEQAASDTSARAAIETIRKHCTHNRPELNRNCNLHDAGVVYAYDEILRLIDHLSTASDTGR